MPKITKLYSVFSLIYLIVFLTASQAVQENANIFAEDQLTANTLDLMKAEETVEAVAMKNPLDGESLSAINEFQDITRLYQKISFMNNSKIKTLRKLLARLNKLCPSTAFLQGQRDMMRASIRYRLGIRGTAAQNLIHLIQLSPCLVIKEESARILISQSLVNNEVRYIQHLKNEYYSDLSQELQAYIDILVADPQTISTNDVQFIVNNFIHKPLGTHRHPNEYIHLLKKFKSQLPLSELDNIIDNFLRDGKISPVLGIIRLRLSISPASYDLLANWSERLKNQEYSLVEIVRLFQSNSEGHTAYIEDYNFRRRAANRGRAYCVKLSSYRGGEKTPYNADRAEKYFHEYLQGDVEQKYLQLNSERMFRNFLAFKKYDKITHYAALIREKVGKESVPSYIEFWESYVLLQNRDADKALPLLGNIIAHAPESYYGIIAQDRLAKIFSSKAFSRTRYFNELKANSGNSQGLLKYAMILYYMGNIVEKSQAERILVSKGYISVKSSKKINREQKILMAAYLTLGLEKEARYLVYKSGVVNPYLQDMLFAQYFFEEDLLHDWNSVVAHRSLMSQELLSITVGKEALAAYYPTPYLNHVNDVVKNISKKMDPYLIYSIMRTESFYKPKARSHAGARGLMQIMPKTGEWLAGKYLLEDSQYSLYNPQVNVYLGSIYLYDNIDKMGFLPAIAAYNSGPTFVNKLIKRYNPGTSLELVEIHPKIETRNYVKKVIESYQRYKIVYDNQSLEILNLIS